ncbi:hypothetical protein, partial [Limisphaera ngatamarikiensis]|uniref:hypothetical protein n=1 Tax=Limisphaera ngatamarikiensis TaxID=1324935 RepID=UPI00197FF84A
YSTPNPKKSSPAGAIPQAMAKVWGDLLNERLEHEVVICVAYYRDGRRKEIISDWRGGMQTPGEFRNRYPYLGRIIENKYWIRCWDRNPEMALPPHTHLGRAVRHRDDVDGLERKAAWRDEFASAAARRSYGSGRRGKRT